MFDDDLHSFASYLHSLIYVNHIKLNLSKYNVKYKYNHCTILKYQADGNIKKLHMGYHYDMQHNLIGKLKNWITSQYEDTSTVIVT